MIEKDFQRLFGHWLNENKPKVTTAYELKIEKGKSFRFDKVRGHQLKALSIVERGAGLYHKISDSPIFKGMKTRFTAQKPFDCLWLIEIEAYIVILFYKPRQPKEMFFISPTEFSLIEELYKAKGKVSIKYEELKCHVSPVVMKIKK